VFSVPFCVRQYVKTASNVTSTMPSGGWAIVKLSVADAPQQTVRQRENAFFGGEFRETVEFSWCRQRRKKRK